MKKNSSTTSVSPIPLRAIHFAYTFPRTDTMMALLLPVIKHIAGLATRHRIVEHPGHSIAILQSLTKYGIVRENIPTFMDGGIDRKECWPAWVDRQAALEESKSGARAEDM